jgi:predicted nucleotidyltransferase
MRSSTVAAAVAALQAELEATPGCIGAAFFGSGQRGALAPHSDLDFYVLHTGDQQWHEGRRSHGHLLEISFAPVGTLRRLLESRNPTVTHALATGEVLFDVRGEIAALGALARELWAVGPPRADGPEGERWRFRLTDLIFDLRDLAADGVDAAAVGALLVQRAVEAASACHGFWPPPRKGMLEALWRDCTALAPLVSDYYAAPSAAAALRVGEHVLGSIGGELVEYRTEPRSG